MIFKQIYLIIILFTIIRFVDNVKLNVPRALLPIFQDFQMEYTLQATDGCYKWHTNVDNLFKIMLINADPIRKCSRKVQIRTISDETKRQTGAVFAENTLNGQILRCDITLDQIYSLKIETITKELHFEEGPEKFQVIAYDSQGNSFSTLENVEFEWIYSDNLKYIKFLNSAYEIPEEVVKLEQNDKMGAVILLEGVKTGSAKVTVRLPFEEYSHINGAEVDLFVTRNIFLQPNNIFIMPGDFVTIKSFYVKNNSMEEFSPGDTEYFYIVENSEILSIDSKTGHLTALKEGQTMVLLHDKLLLSNTNYYQIKSPSVQVFVQKPHNITLNIFPNNNWAIIVGDQYEITVEIYSKYRKLHQSERVQVCMNVSAGNFYVIEKSLNGSWLIGYGLRPGTVQIYAIFEGLSTEHVQFPFNGRQFIIEKQIFIYPQIEIIPNLVVLPWDSLVMPKYEIQLIAKGGDGKFLWTSTDNDIGCVSQSGIVRTYSNGEFEIAATMMRNHYNKQFVQFAILPPTQLEIVDFILETEIGQTVYLYVALYADYKDRNGDLVRLPFTKCHNLPLQVKHNTTAFYHNRSDVNVMPSVVGSACTIVAMVALKDGTTDVSVSYSFNQHIFEDKIKIHSFRPLVLFEPQQQQQIVLAIGSSINLIFIGGPNIDNERLLQISDSNIISATDVTASHNTTINGAATVIQVVCNQFGETTFRLSISNKCNRNNCRTRTSSVLTRIICGKPYRMYLIEPNSLTNHLDDCPLLMNSTEEDSAVVRSTEDLKLEVAIYDEFNNKFLNASSLKINWVVSPLNAAQILNKNELFVKNITYGSVVIPLKLYQTIKLLTSKYSQVDIKASIKGYKMKYIKMVPILATFKALPINEMHFSQNNLILYNHPNNVHVVELLYGSGHFEIDIINEKLANIIITKRKIQIQPLYSGIIHIKVYDLCLLLNQPAILRIQIVSVGIVRVDMVDKIEIGKCVPSILRLYDENDHLIIVPELNMVGIRAKFEKNCATIKKDENKIRELELGEIHYLIQGTEKCETSLIFTVINGNDDDEISSSPVVLEIFEPISLKPNNYTTLINVVIQFSVIGGPSRHVQLLFTTQNNDTVYVNDKGIILAKKIGKTQITVSAVGIHPTDGTPVLYSKFTADVNVIILKEVRIAAPLTRFQVGSTVPFWCYGLPDISPLTLGSIQNPHVHFLWRVNDNIIVEITNILHVVGIDARRIKKLSIRAVGLQPGITELNLHISIYGPIVGLSAEQTAKLTAKIEIEIVPQFYLLEYSNYVHLLMAPNSEMQIETNLDKTYMKLDYSLSSNSFNNKNGSHQVIITLSSSGLVKSNTILGDETVIVTATDELGMKQKIIVVIQVERIHYMSLIINANWRIHSSSIIEFIPVGTIFEVQATFHDYLGNQFHSGPKQLHVRLNRCDIIQVKKSTKDATIELRTIQTGFVVMKFWADGIEKTTDYVKFHVEQSVKPVVKHLTSGDIICMSTPVIDENRLPGHWRSSDPSLVTINPALDAAFVKNRNGIVSLTHSLLPAFPIIIQIHRVTEIEFEMPDRNLKLSNGRKDALVRYVLVLQSEKSKNIKSNNLIQGWRCRVDIRKLVRPLNFKCFMSFSNRSIEMTTNLEDIFNISTSWVPETGQYACKIIDKGVNDENISVLQTDIIVWATTEDDEIESERLTLKFIPSFYVNNETILLEGENKAYIDVIGLPIVLKQLHVTVADDRILNVNYGEMISNTRKRFIVDLIDYHWRIANIVDAVGITISSKLTQQEETVILRVTKDFSNQLCTAARPSLILLLIVYKNVIVMIFSVLLIAIPTFFFYSKYIQESTRTRSSTPASTILMTCRQNLLISSKCSAICNNEIDSVESSSSTTTSTSLITKDVRFVGNLRPSNDDGGGESKFLRNRSNRRISILDIRNRQDI